MIVWKLYVPDPILPDLTSFFAMRLDLGIGIGL